MKRTPERTRISREQFHALTRPLVGIPVSYTWRRRESAPALDRRLTRASSSTALHAVADR
jgi:hypothetical protein